MKRLITFLLIVIMTMGIATTYAAAPAGLKDIKDHWAEKEIQSLYDKKIITGDTKSMYEPKREITRGEFVTLLAKVMGYKLIDGNTFKDLNYDTYWARKNIETAIKEGAIIPEEWGESFWGDVPITREQMTIMMARTLKLEPSTNYKSFPDIDNGLITKAYEEYLIKGIEQNSNILFVPGGLTTKAEAATIIARILEYKENPAVYRNKMIAEAKANKFIEPEFEVRNINDKLYYVEVYIKNHAEYDKDYSFMAECVNYPQINKHWTTGLWGPPFEVDRATWQTGEDLDNNKGYMMLIRKEPYYADKAMKKSFTAKLGMTFEYKVTIKKGEKTKEYKVPVTILQQEEK